MVGWVRRGWLGVETYGLGLVMETLGWLVEWSQVGELGFWAGFLGKGWLVANFVTLVRSLDGLGWG